MCLDGVSDRIRATRDGECASMGPEMINKREKPQWVKIREKRGMEERKSLSWGIIESHERNKSTKVLEYQVGWQDLKVRVQRIRIVNFF